LAAGRTVYSGIVIEHKKSKQNPPGRNLTIMENVIAKGGILSPRLTYYYGRELMYNGRTDDAAAAFKRVLDMPGGWVENKIGACLDMAGCLQTLEQPERALNVLFRSFLFAPPRAEIACKIAELFFNRSQYEMAAYWYMAALKCRLPIKNLSFVQGDYYNFIPLIQLSVIYDRLGRRKTAKKYNERAGRFKPDHPSYLHNTEYFSHI
jgi:tetratricopeptide (TPR) repeat protein